LNGTAIEVENVAKRYQLGATHSGQLAEQIEERIRSLLRLTPRAAVSHAGEEEFWALRDISLEIGEGEAFGLIGPNGAGKSTLLKLLSRITLPTEGRITIAGRVGSLLEVGTGFHTELTGRENVFLNGAILGMRRQEIIERFPAIVEFSGIEKFIDTPVKRYSSGMFIRLAFSVAVHLEPEILIVDEVLAVGDYEFQRKSLEKMGEVARSGRTIIFVSHNLASIQRLCDRVAWLDHGRIVEQGDPPGVIASYMKKTGATQVGGEATVGRSAHRMGTQYVRLEKLALLDEAGRPVEALRLGEPFSVRLVYEVSRRVEECVLELGISSADGTRVLTVQNIDGDRPTVTLEPGTHQVDIGLDAEMLPGEFTIDAGVHHIAGTTHDFIERVLTFTALNVAHRGADTYPWDVVRGSVRVSSSWSVSSPAPTDQEAATA
jgi:lipopolysaccharide transport system ATP-binding protein